MICAVMGGSSDGDRNFADRGFVFVVPVADPGAGGEPVQLGDELARVDRRSVARGVSVRARLKMILAVILALILVEFHGPSGQRLEINPAAVSSLREPIDIRSHLAPGAHCVIVMSNG